MEVRQGKPIYSSPSGTTKEVNETITIYGRSEKRNLIKGDINMKVLVAYISQTGNTKKVAEAIFNEIHVEKDLKEIKELDELDGYDLYFIGCPIQAYGPAQPAKVLLEKHSSGKDIILFATHAAPEDSENVLPWLNACREAAVGANIVGLFNCRGELAEKVADFMKKSNDPNLSAWADQRDETLDQPDSKRLASARAFTRDIMQSYLRDLEQKQSKQRSSIGTK